MKLIISGASGFVGAELIRQSLRLPQVTSLVALSRRPIELPAGVDAAKFKQVLVKDYDDYPEEARREFVGASACIWTVAITPTKSKMYNVDTVRHVCQTVAVAGFNAMLESSPSTPFRFIYMSGETAERDQTKSSGRMYGEYLKMRGEAENKILAIAKEHSGQTEALIAKPGLITSNINWGRAVSSALVKGLSTLTNGIPTLSLEEVSAAMLSQVLNGFDKDTLQSSELRDIGAQQLKAGFASQ